MFRKLLADRISQAKGSYAYVLDPAIGDLAAFQILLTVAAKAVRGTVGRTRLRHSEGTILVGRRVRITHPQLITCGRGFVVEDDAELHGLSKDGLCFGNNVTIGRGAQIRPSGYYGRALGVGLLVGNNSNLGPSCYVGASGGISI